MRIEIRALDGPQYKVPCLVCGYRDWPYDAACYTEDGSWVCSSCVRSGEEGIRATLRKHAEYHREMAENFERVAETEEFELPTPEELDRAEAAVKQYNTERLLKESDFDD